jgi:alpha-tubulin suppressor-like RCC1 family protein
MRRVVAFVLFVTGVVVGSGAGMAPAQATGDIAIFPTTQIAAGGQHTCALISDGRVTCWGAGSDGQLGTGNNNDSLIPVEVSGGALANKTVTQIAAGGQHACALISDGTVTCWGYGGYGQLGTGNNNSSNVPVAVTGGALANKTVTQIATGDAHTCALISDGTVTCWGWGGYGQLGTGNTNSSDVPVAVTGGALTNKTVTQITTGYYHTCALISDGTVTCWGYNYFGTLGTGNNNDSLIPVEVSGGALTNKAVTQIATSGARTCALISDGTVTCWGYGSDGQLGTGDTTNSNIPVEVSGGALTNKTVTQIATGYDHTCALISDGTVTCWGYGGNGRLGTGNTTNSNIPVAVTGVALANKTVTQISTGSGHTCALISDGTVTCWGNGGGGQLGTGNNFISNIPVAVTGGALENKTVTQITTGYIHTCALISDGTVTCWGYGSDGRLGTGNNNNSNIPVAVTGGALENKTVTQISTGDAHTCALISDGTVTCWGWGAYGQLGTGDTNTSNIPVAVTGGALENKTVTQITSGSGHTCALISDGTVTCWGAGGNGQLGTGNNNNSNIPVAVTGGALENKTVTQIDTGYTHTCALISDGAVTCWGLGAYGQLGTGNNNNSNIPVAVTGGALENKTVTQIAAGSSHMCALISDGAVTCWGAGSSGQLGTGDNNTSNTPVAVTGGALENKTVTQIATGYNHTCALISDGTVTCWGFGGYGQLGTGNTNNSNVPMAIVWPVQAVNTVQPSISGTAQVGQTLTANDGTWTGTPTPTFTYQWYTCTAKITSATQTVPGTCSEISTTENTLELTSAHAGKYMTVEVTGTSTGTDPVSWLAISTATTVKMRAVNTVRPSISGTARVGKRLTVNKGTWTGTPTPKFTRKWYACTAKIARSTQTIPGTCQLIAGATKATFKLTAAQKNKFIAVQVTGRSRGTTATSWLSKTSAKVR